MACYVDEDQVWKCPNHPSSKRRRTGICPSCLRDRLITLCPECANTRPCACTPSDSTSTSSSSSSSFQYSRAGSLRHAEFGRMSNLIENEPAFRKSRSVSFPFLRSISKSKHAFSGGNGGGDQSTLPLPRVIRSKISFWSVFKLSKTKKCDLHYDESSNKSEYSSPASVKRRGWYIPSPMKAFMHSKTTKLHIHERSPMHRG